MAPLLIRHRSGLPADEAWRRLTDWERHADHVPFTRTTVTTPSARGVGARFVARTGLGPLAVDDVMEVVARHPPSAAGPGRCRLAKRGSVIKGWAELEVGMLGTGSYVVRREDLRLKGRHRLLAPVVNRCGTLLFARVVRRLLAG
ncbi:hypothetical protein AF335_14445 [Streptomyces eurocidicus]|uniref:Immediate-early protein 2 n=1 Tax=Streptomyces eurocidicus TaxID=66423 RepID=A0A2N8NVG7_STREU|nr:Immediate-early protein 2 [Streptomyces eurocidicus]MBB5122506.1 hypothetical protein [Streptomyces eurocidicus]MBF6056237.1 SRPBCC family protein [Streptomyces eurocidicus]PNE32754.1 hypothetical protein AF335_14445 [Streptomyces eurocidicus]